MQSTKVTKFVKPNGPINYQLCFTKKKPIIFEINPRFSGTTPLRNNFGVNEIDILIDSLEGKKIKKTKVKIGTIFRYFEDYFVSRKKINL